MKIYLRDAFEIFYGEFQFSIDFCFVLSTEIKLFIYIDISCIFCTLRILCFSFQAGKKWCFKANGAWELFHGWKSTGFDLIPIIYIKYYKTFRIAMIIFNRRRRRNEALLLLVACWREKHISTILRIHVRNRSLIT